MSFVSLKRKNVEINDSNDQNISVRNIRINPRILDDSKSFEEEIPTEFRISKENISFFKQRFGRVMWENIIEDAKDLDAKFDCRNPQRRVTADADKASEKLKSDSIDYLDKNKSHMRENDTYTENDSEEDIIISKRTLLAAKMINKIVRSVEDGGLLSTLDDSGNEIKEGAKNVTLFPSEDFKNSADTTILPGFRNFGSTMKFKDCRKEKLFEHEPRAEDCRQNELGDCWLQSTLINILNHRGSRPIKEMLKDDGASGNVKVRLYKPEKVNDKRDFFNGNYVPRVYTVPKQIPVTKILNGSAYNKGANWVHYVEAAVAKSGIRDKAFGDKYIKEDKSGNKFRDYSSCVEGDLRLGAYIILGGNAIKMVEEKNLSSDEIYNKAKFAKDNEKLASISFKEFVIRDSNGNTVMDSGGIPKTTDEKKGLFAEHEYTLCGYKDDGGIKYIRLINPHFNRVGRSYVNKKGQEDSFEGIGDEGFWLKLSTASKYMEYICLEK